MFKQEPEKNKASSKYVEQENHVNEVSSLFICSKKDKRRGRPIPGFAREIILKVAAICEQEAKNNFSKYPLTAPTKRAATYTGVSERTIQRIRNEDRRRKVDENGVKGEGSVEDTKKSGRRRDHPDQESNYSTMKRKSKKGQTIPNSARDVISKVIDACDNELKDGEYMVPFICKSKRTALYTGVSQRTVQRIKNEDEKRNKVNQEKILMTPGRKRKRSTFNDKIDDFDFHSIRRLIDDLILVKKISPTCTALHTALKERINFPYSEDTLYRLLHSKGFEWHKGSKGKRVLLEKPEIFRGRLNYLQKIKNHESQGNFIVYLDEKWIGKGSDDSYVDNHGIFGVKGGICCSGRLVVLNEFSAMGFIRRAERLFRPNIVDSELQPEISTVDKWMKENLFPNIPSHSLLVMSRNPYKKEYGNIPNEYSSKASLIEFLKEKNLKYTLGQTCPDLYGIIKNYLCKLPCEWAQLDKLIESHGHMVLRLPPCMSEFNPIELAWADIKRYVRDKNPTGKISPKLVEKITLQAIECLQNDTMQGYVNHVIQMEDYFWDKQRLIQDHYDNVIKCSSTSDIHDNNVIDSNVASNITVLPNVVVIHPSNNNANIDLNTTTTFNSCDNMQTVSASNIITDHSASNMNPINYAPMLPHNQLGYVKNLAVPVLDKSAVICQIRGLDSNMVHAGPSYLNL